MVMKKNLVMSALIGMGFGFPVTLLCMGIFGGFNPVVREFLIWMTASALYGILSGVLFDYKNDLPLIAAIGIHFLGCVAITVGAALICGYVSSVAGVIPVLIPFVAIYVVIYGICFLAMKNNEKQINQALKEK
jgi:uncharacterized membrane protein